MSCASPSRRSDDGRRSSAWPPASGGTRGGGHHRRERRRATPPFQEQESAGTGRATPDAMGPREVAAGLSAAPYRRPNRAMTGTAERLPFYAPCPTPSTAHAGDAAFRDKRGYGAHILGRASRTGRVHEQSGCGSGFAAGLACQRSVPVRHRLCRGRARWVGASGPALPSARFRAVDPEGTRRSRHRRLARTGRTSTVSMASVVVAVLCVLGLRAVSGSKEGGLGGVP